MRPTSAAGRRTFGSRTAQGTPLPRSQAHHLSGEGEDGNLLAAPSADPERPQVRHLGKRHPVDLQHLRTTGEACAEA
eukprot:100296-Alexandrium_andersonii.AAC.1